MAKQLRETLCRSSQRKHRREMEFESIDDSIGLCFAGCFPELRAAVL